MAHKNAPHAFFDGVTVAEEDLDGRTVYNDSGSPIALGVVVNLRGWNAARKMWRIDTTSNTSDHTGNWVTTQAIADGATGVVRQVWLSPAALNTNGASVGDAVYYASSSTGWSLTAPTTPNLPKQVLGRVHAVSATLGQIAFDTRMPPITWGTAALGSRAVNPDNIGLLVWNATGGTLTAGTLVYISGYNGSQFQPQISAANVSNQGQPAEWIVAADIANGASGSVGKHLALTGQNTNAGNVGDPVYLASSGGWTLSALTAAGQFQQMVGHIAIKSATIGMIDFDLESPNLVTIGTNQIQNKAVTSALCDPTVIQTAEISLSNAEIKALRATPKTLVAAQGANTVIEFVSALWILKAGANALTEAGDNAAVKYNNGAGTAISETVETTGFIDQTTDTLTTIRAKQDGIIATATFANKPIVLHNAGAAEWAGNAAADATMRVKVAYRVWSTT